MVSHKVRETLFRTRSVVLTERDELAFSRVLREFCPAVMFMGNTPENAERRSITLPNIPHHCHDRATIALPAPGQEKQWQLNLDMRCLMIWPRCHLDLRRSSWEWLDPEKKWAFDPPLLGWGEVIVGFPRDDPEMMKFGMKLLRLVNKVTWKRTGFGLDACRWSQAGGKERRGLGAGELVDSIEKIELNKYYDDSLWDDRLPDEPTGVRVEY